MQRGKASMTVQAVKLTHGLAQRSSSVGRFVGALSVPKLQAGALHPRGTIGQRTDVF